MSRDLVYRGVSLSDFLKAGIKLEVTGEDDHLKISGGTEDGKPYNMKDLPQHLYSLGIVNDHNVKVMAKAMHRTMDGRMVDNYRIIGKERTDKQWLASNFASEEAKMASSRMRDMVSQTNRLANGGD